jgi:predicted TIM-barrel fold metal-dependent hydrolase
MGEDLQGDRLREMDEFGIEFAIQSLNSPAVQAAPNVTEAIALAQRENDVLANEVVKRPDRLAGFAALPMQDLEAAAEEMKRCIKDLDFVGVMVIGFSQRENQNCLVYYDVPEFLPFWAVVEELEIPFYLHPTNPLTDQKPFFDRAPLVH